MNKKLLFGIMSLAALAACTNDDFESQNVVAEQTSPIQFELINGNDASMRASWSTDNNAVSFSAADGDLFTLYHGGNVAGDPLVLTGFENATYKATKDASSGTAKLTTPSMIKTGKAVMVWPADTAFLSRDFTGGNFHISIPAEQTNYVNQLPYVSDLIEIGDYDEDAPYNTEGYNRTYPIFMRQMGSLLTLKADYAGTDAQLKVLAEAGDDAIKAITVDKITLSTGAGTEFTKMIPVKFTTANANWPTATSIHHAWKNVTAFDVASIVDAGKTTTLSAEGKSLLDGNQGAKIVMLPQNTISAPGVVDAAVVVDTYYGRVVVAAPGVTVDGSDSKYTAEEIKDAWIRYIKQATTAESYEAKATSPTTSTTDADQNGKYMTTSSIANGMMQTINWFSSAERKSTNTTVKDEPVGGLLTRYVKVDLSKLDMSKLHIKDDKQLRDVARVWQALKLDPVTVYLDGDKTTGEFEISQKTIKVINDINDAAAKETKKRAFTVMPCTEANETCTDIVITGGGDIQDIAFIKKNGTATANVVLADEATAWKWNGTTDETKKVLVGEGVKRIFNKGTMVNDKTATLAIWNVEYATGTNVMTVGTQNTDLIFENDGTWDITGKTVLNVRIDVSNYGTVNIAEGAQYRQDGSAVIFHNLATTRPQRFLADGAANVGIVNNSGVFATVNSGKIYNYGGLIEHLTKNAKTYITKNQNGPGFASPFSGANRMGRINLKYENKDEDNISISASAPITEGFVSITITEKDGEKDLKTSLVENSFVNYIIVNGGVEKISDLDTKIKYVEINQTGTEMVWNLDAPASYTGLIVLSPVNIKLGQTISAEATYLGDEMYVGGIFNNTATKWDAYYGDTSGNVATKYITYK